MIYLLYVLVAIGVVYLSTKASDYVDLLDKTTSLSGAFIGGVMLSAVTSLPEFFTSISATLFLDKPGLCIGNILGSDILNSAVLATGLFVAIKSFSKAKVANSHIYVTISVAMIYGVILLNKFNILNVEIFSLSITSILIIILYIIGVKCMSSENGTIDEEDDTDDDVTDLSLNQIVTRFIFVSIGIIILSIIITYITDEIAGRLHLGNGLAGALFLGIATSLPEISSTFALIRKRNFNIAIGNITGSNLFNFIILGITDILYVGKGIYDFSDPKTMNLLGFGAISTLLLLVTLKCKNKVIKIISCLGVIGCYIAFLVV